MNISGIEIVYMGLSYYEHTGDADFLEKRVIPIPIPLFMRFEKSLTVCLNRG